MGRDIFQNPLEKSIQSARIDTRPMLEKFFWELGRPSNWENIRNKAIFTGIFFPPLAPIALAYISLASLSLWINGGTLPIRLPIISRRTDHSQTFINQKNNKPIYAKAGGIFYIGTVRNVPGVYDEHIGEQITISNSDARTHFAYFGTTGSGKPQPVWTKVATPDGFKTLGEFVEGDIVCTPDGKTAVISAIYDQDICGIFKLEFEDGRITWASDDHVWNTVDSDNKEDQVHTIDLFKQIGSGHLPSKPVFIRLPDVGDFEGKTSDQRYQLIGEMMLSGGAIRPRDILFTCKSKLAAYMMQNLVRSVGGKARIKSPFLNIGSLYFVEIRHPTPWRLFSNERQIDIAHSLAIRAPCAKALRLVSVKSDGYAHCRCLAVNSADHLYITDDFIVTHNTEAILSFCLNPLSWGSGFILVDGKAEVITPNKVYALCRRLMREDDFRVLNFMNAGRDIWEIKKSESRYSNTFNPATRSSSSQLTQLMVSLMPEGGSDPMWKGLAVGMIDAINRGLKYKQYKGLLEIDFGIIRDAIDLESVIDLCGDFDPERPGGPMFPDLDTALIFKPLKAYLLNLPGFDWEEMMHKRRGEREVPEDLNKQHNFRSMQFMRQLTMLCDAYGTVFKHLYPEVDMDDVVRMRRILVVLLPSLGMSDEESEAVGKLVITSLRMMMARTLGDKIEGDYAELNESRPTSSPAPFLVIMDEIGYYFAQGMSVMYAQARSLGFAMMAAGQTLAPIYKDKIKHEAKGVLANAGCFFMGLMKDPDETSELFMKLAGEALVSEGTGFEGDTSGSSVQYTDRFAASWNYRKRVEYAELSGMKEGECILVWKNRVIRVSNFYVFGAAKIPRKTPMLLNKLTPIVSPKLDDLAEFGCINYPKLSKDVPIDVRLSGVFLARYDAARNNREVIWSRTANQLVKENKVANSLINASEYFWENKIGNIDNNSRLISIFYNSAIVPNREINTEADTDDSNGSSGSSGGLKTKLENTNNQVKKINDDIEEIENPKEGVLQDFEKNHRQAMTTHVETDENHDELIKDKFSFAIYSSNDEIIEENTPSGIHQNDYGYSKDKEQKLIDVPDYDAEQDRDAYSIIIAPNENNNIDNEDIPITPTSTAFSFVITTQDKLEKLLKDESTVVSGDDVMGFF